jgi:hypothetical protein
MKSALGNSPPGTNRLLAYLLLDRLNVQHVCEWAVVALEAGFDTEALAMLSSISLEREPNLYEAMPYLRQALHELHIPEPTDQEEVLRAYAKSLAEDIASSQMPARAALDEMHSVVVGPLNHPSDLMGWCYLWEGNSADASFTQISEKDTELEAKVFAKMWLASLDQNAA